MTVAIAPINPFVSQTVSSLRKIEPPIRWLNDAALRKLIATFEIVEEKPHRCELIQLVLSRGDGYGKSHLLGRLIQELDGRATCVAITTFNNPRNCWSVLLQSILDELAQPELKHHLPYPPTQLDELAHQVFGFIAVMIADKQEVNTPLSDENRNSILHGAIEKWDLSDPHCYLGAWVNETLNINEQNEAREAIIIRLLKASTLHTYGDDATAMNWLLVLHRYASDRADEDSRQMCLEWMFSNQMGDPNESPIEENDQNIELNIIARQQVLNLLALAKLYRPFLLCFDQINTLPNTIGLSSAFGSMLFELVRTEGAHFSIVTANTQAWETSILPEFDSSCIPCLAAKMELVGLTREQGRSLAEQRLLENKDSTALQEQFLNKDWLQEQFSQGSLGHRDFLSRCELRYQELVPTAIRPAEDTEMPEEETIPSAYDLNREAPSSVTSETLTQEKEARSIITEPLTDFSEIHISVFEPEKEDLSPTATESLTVFDEIPLISQDAEPNDLAATEAVEIADVVENSRNQETAFVVQSEKTASPQSETLSNIYVKTLEPHIISIQDDRVIPIQDKTVASDLASPKEFAWIVASPQDNKANIQDAPLIELHEDRVEESAHVSHEIDTETRLDESRTSQIEGELKIADTLSVVSSVSSDLIAPQGATTSEKSHLEPRALQPITWANRSLVSDSEHLREVMLKIVYAHRFASYIAISDELRRKMQRSVSVDEAILCAQTTTEIHVYADGPNAAFLWQGPN